MDVSAVGSGASTPTLAPPPASGTADPNSPAAAAGAAGSAPAQPHMSGDVMVRSDGSVDGAATLDHYRQAISSAWNATTQSPVVQHALAATSTDPATRAAGVNGLTHDAAHAYSSVSSAVKSGMSAVSDAAKDAVNITDPAARERTAQRASAIGHAAVHAAAAVVEPVADDAVALGKTVAHASQHAGSSWADIPVAGLAAASNFVPETKGAGLAAKTIEAGEHVTQQALVHSAEKTTVSSAITHTAGHLGSAVETAPQTVERAASSSATSKTHAALQRLPGWNAEQRTITVQSKDEVAQARRAFSSPGGPRERFVKDLAANHSDELRASGFSDGQIREMAESGRTPGTHNVHHVQSLKQGGSNDPSNLILLRNDAEHWTITGHQNSVTSAHEPGDRVRLDVLVPPSGKSVYP